MPTNNEGLSVALPLTIDPTFGPYSLNTTFEDLAKQNLKMLLLTNKGERIMRPNFGVGLRSYLFEQNSPVTFGVLDELIRSQVSQYLPYIGINSINFATSESVADLDPNFMGITISFTILPLQVSTFLQINANES
jgi:phage baseplate assembly protein W